MSFFDKLQTCLRTKSLKQDESTDYFPPDPAFTGRTISQLVDFIAAAKTLSRDKKPKRGIWRPSGWCLAECLRVL